jgi:protein YibB
VSDITLVTAFFDIGRGEWKQSVQKNGGPLPHYLERSADVYIERFTHLTKLDNDIVVFTSPDLVARLQEIADECKARVKVVSVDLNTFAERRAQIETIQTSPDFVQKINPYQCRNPEYWNPDYVLVTSLKAHFVAEAVREELVSTDTVAWIDFGYCRSEDALGGAEKWSYDFDLEKIHLWNFQAPTTYADDILNAVQHNHVIIHGAMVVAHKGYWAALAATMSASLDSLIGNNLVDDDQGLWLMSYYGNPEVFELHKLAYDADPFVVFRDYNDK